MEALDIHALNSLIHLLRAMIIIGFVAAGVSILSNVIKAIARK